MSETGRIARLEDLLARVRDRTNLGASEEAPSSVGPDSALPGVGPGALPSDEELDPLLSRRAFERALEGVGPEPAAMPPDVDPGDAAVASDPDVDPGDAAVASDPDREEVRRALARRIDEALADDEPSVPFEEEGDGWEAEPLSLERDDEPVLVRPPAEVLLVPDSGEHRMPLSSQVSLPPPPGPDDATAYVPTKALEHAVKQATGVPVSAPPAADDPWQELTAQLRERRPSSRRAHLALEDADSDRRAGSDEPVTSPPRAVPEPPVVATPPDGTPSRAEEDATREDEAPPAREPRRRRKGRGRRLAAAAAASSRERPAPPEPAEPTDVPPTRRSAHAPPPEEEGSMLRTIAVGFVISAVALGLGLWLGRSSGDGATSAPPVEAAPAELPRVPPRPTATPQPPVARAAVRAPAASASAPAPKPATEPPPGALREEEAWLLVQGDDLQVYVQGALAGGAGQWLKVPCGIRHVRLADATPSPDRRSLPAWIGDGGPLSIPCRGQTSVRAEDVAKP